MSAVSAYVNSLKGLLDSIDTAQVEHLAELILGVWRANGRLLLMGNGGSSSTASHIVNDFQKCIHLDGGKPVRAMCLSDCTPLVLAWANDTEYANVYVPQVECWAEKGDLVIGISGSGNSPNILRAMEAANARGAVSFGMAGFGGGKLANIATECLVVHSTNMQQVEDIHMVALHIAFTLVRETVKGEKH